MELIIALNDYEACQIIGLCQNSQETDRTITIKMPIVFEDNIHKYAKEQINANVVYHLFDGLITKIANIKEYRSYMEVTLCLQYNKCEWFEKDQKWRFI